MRDLSRLSQRREWRVSADYRAKADGASIAAPDRGEPWVIAPIGATVNTQTPAIAGSALRFTDEAAAGAAVYMSQNTATPFADFAAILTFQPGAVGTGDIIIILSPAEANGQDIDHIVAADAIHPVLTDKRLHMGYFSAASPSTLVGPHGAGAPKAVLHPVECVKDGETEHLFRMRIDPVRGLLFIWRPDGSLYVQAEDRHKIAVRSVTFEPHMNGGGAGGNATPRTRAVFAA